jgi:F0F1-type ATP synthase membrane subunit b/b'
MPNQVNLETILQFIQTLGWVKGVFAIFFFLMHGLYFMAMRGRLKDRQREIDRLAADNKEYRERFVAMIDKAQGYTHKKGER